MQEKFDEENYLLGLCTTTNEPFIIFINIYTSRSSHITNNIFNREIIEFQTHCDMVFRETVLMELRKRWPKIRLSVMFAAGEDLVSVPVGSVPELGMEHELFVKNSDTIDVILEDGGESYEEYTIGIEVENMIEPEKSGESDEGNDLTEKEVIPPKELKATRDVVRSNPLVKEVIRYVEQWKEYIKEGLERKDAAKKVGKKKKTLDDYKGLLKYASEFGFEFKLHEDSRIGVLREFRRINQKPRRKKDVFHIIKNCSS